MFFDLLAPLLRVEENIVRVAVLFFPSIVHALKPRCIVLLQIAQRIHHLVIRAGARVFQRDPVRIEKLLAEQAKLLQPLDAQHRGLKTTIHRL